MAGELKVGVVGLGLGRLHVAAYAGAAEVGRLVVCDPDAGRVESVRGAHPAVAAAYADLGAMLAAEHLDAVSIVTPDHLHRPQAERCFRAGVHVLLTKPLATNLEDGRAIVRASEAASRLLMVAHERRFRRRTRAIRALLDSGDLGEIIHLRIDKVTDKRGQFRRSPWYASAEAGRTALVGTGIHEVDLLRHLIGRPIESVCAFSNHLGTLAYARDKTTAALYRFEGDTIGQVTVTLEAHWPQAGMIDDQFRLVGTRGIIVGNRLARDGHDGWDEIPSEPGEQAIATGTRGCVDAFLRAIVHGEPVAVGGRDAFASLAACVAADESAATGRSTVPAAF